MTRCYHPARCRSASPVYSKSSYPADAQGDATKELTDGRIRISKSRGHPEAQSGTAEGGHYSEASSHAQEGGSDAQASCDTEDGWHGTAHPICYPDDFL